MVSGDSSAIAGMLAKGLPAALDKTAIAKS
jgi:hypothetical protein